MRYCTTMVTTFTDIIDITMVPTSEFSGKAQEYVESRETLDSRGRMLK